MKKLSNLYLAFVFIVLYLPIFYLIGYAFNAGDDMNSFTGFSLSHFKTMFGDGRLMLILTQTFFLAFLSALIATIIGTFGAIYIYQSRKKYQEAFLSLNNILMVAPDVMIGASFLILFTQLKFSLGFWTVLSSHVAFSIPIVVLMVLPRLKEMNGDMIHAAYDLGASQFQMFKEIMLPYLTPSIIAGYFMAFTYSLDDFAVTFFVTGNGFSTLSVEIYSRARKGISLEINALSALVFLFREGGASMKKLYSFLAGIVAIILVLWGIATHLDSKINSRDSQKLVIYNWGDYIDPELLTQFTEETGIQVQYETFDSNEAMYTKIKQGGTTYDIAIPSAYMINKMTAAKLLVPLAYSKLEALEHIGPEFLNQSFDPGNKFSIPYFWGTLGIVYNETMVDEAPEHWDDLWKPEYKNSIMLFDGAREVLGLGLNSLGYSLNSKDTQQLEETVDKLYKLTPNIKAIVADEMKGYMIQNNAAIGVTFSGEASQMLEKNENLRYVVPTEASNLWFDNMVIPKTVKNQDAAYAFINFMLKPENALKNAEYVGYSTPNLPAKELLPEEKKEDKAFYPDPETMKHLEVYEKFDHKWTGKYSDLFLQFKMYRK